MLLLLCHIYYFQELYIGKYSTLALLQDMSPVHRPIIKQLALRNIKPVAGRRGVFTFEERKKLAVLNGVVVKLGCLDRGGNQRYWC